jgi:hypothetical protein
MMAGPQPDLSLLDDVIKRTSVFPSPEPSFDPLTHPDELERFGLPPLPNQAETPEAYKFWHKLYSPPLVWIQGAQFGLVTDPGPRTAFERRTTTSTLSESSRNWSGLYITPRDGRMITQVYGSWNVPAINLPAAFANPNRVRSSTWIGLDGQRSYYHSSLPQIGTEQFFKVVGATTTTVYRAFYEWWARDQPSIYAYQPLLLPINARQRVMAVLTVKPPNAVMPDGFVRLIIKNQSTGGFHPVLDVSPPTDHTFSSPLPLKVSGATAEWIMERPTLPTERMPDTLPDYDTITFTRCGAVSALGPGQPGRDETLIGARRITMQRVDAPPQRTVTISQPNTIVAPYGRQRKHRFETTYVP